MLKTLIIKIIISLLCITAVVTGTVVVIEKKQEEKNSVVEYSEIVDESSTTTDSSSNDDTSDSTTTTTKNDKTTTGSDSNSLLDFEHKHTVVIKKGKAATCTKDGLTDGQVCADCGEVLVAQQVIPATGHNYQNGVCSKCRAKEPACEHTNTVKIDAVEATCTTSGLTEGLKCKDCGEILVEQNAIPATGHNYVNGVCSECGHKKHDDCDPTHTAVVEGYAATCTQTGLTDGKVCTDCGQILVAQEVISMVPHSYMHGVCVNCGSVQNTTCAHSNLSKIAGYAATCTTSGLTDGYICLNCKEIVTAQTVIKALGHEYKDGKCIRCGAADPSILQDNETERIDLK